MKPLQTVSCPVKACMQFLEGAWTLEIYWYLKDSSLRFGELKRQLGTVSPKVLTHRLRELESLGAIKREVLDTYPPQVEYSLTDFGKTFIPLIQQIAHIGMDIIQKEKR